MPIQLPNIPALSSKVDTEVRRAFDSLKGLFNKISADGGMVTQGSLTGDLSATPALAALLDGTIPPQIRNFTATGGFSKIMLIWDDPRYRYAAFVEIWRNTVADLGTAQKVGSTTATMYADSPPNTSAAVTYYYWGRIVSTGNIQGPFNATAGTPAHTALDPTYALEVLSGALTKSQLHIDLNSRINLIDADNVSHTKIALMLAELSKYGTANIRRAYGDWGSTSLKGWKSKLHEFAIRPIQQFSYSAGKNATDRGCTCLDLPSLPVRSADPRAAQ